MVFECKTAKKLKIKKIKNVMVMRQQGVGPGQTTRGGLPREYEMVRAAKRNWLAASSLSGIRPLSRTGVSNLSGFHSGSLVVEGDSRHLAVQHYHSLKD